MLLSRSLLSLAACALGVAEEASKAKRPNILFILTDDQDLHMEGVDYMPHLKVIQHDLTRRRAFSTSGRPPSTDMAVCQADIVDKGVSYNRHYCTTALCCPSRLSLWTGKLSHNHNVTTVRPPLGGYPKIVKEGFNDDYLPIWMQNAGYNTYYTGKLWNFHDVDNYNDPHAKGYNSSDFLLDPFTYRYWDAKISHNGEPPESFAGQYSTDVIAQKSRDLLEEALGHDEPWFLTVAPIAPHSNWVYDLTNNNSFVSAPPAAPRHEHMFLDYKIPRGGNFNKPIHGGGGWPGELTPLNDTVITYNDFWQRSRLQSLLAVDDLVHGLMEDLEKSGELDNTYVFYTTDNGYHLSQHAMVGGKMCGLGQLEQAFHVATTEAIG
jgi:arylsulfatase A-like enzyme